MKTNFSLLRFPFSVLLLAIALAGCSKDDDNDDLSGGQGITLTVTSHNERTEFGITAQQLIIDWGDGSAAETYTNLTWEYQNQITHTYTGYDYTGYGIYTVQIKGEGITHFECAGSRVTSLDVSKCQTLQELKCHYNPLTSLNASGCTALQRLDCHFGSLISLDVSKCPALRELFCIGNPLTSLNASGCTALQWLDCGHHQLSLLNVSGCTMLNNLECYNNQLTATVLNTVFTALPNRAQGDGSIRISNNPGAGTCNRAIAQNKGWSVGD